MILDPDIQAAIVARANRAPSVHNTQPARWAFDDGDIQIYANTQRFLDVGDPTLQDAGVSCGAALEGTIMALADQNIKVYQIEDCWQSDEVSTYQGMRLAARLKIKVGASPNSLSPHIDKRFTWRGEFVTPSEAARSSLQAWADSQEDINLVTADDAIADLAKINDAASLKFFKNRAYREELVSYMRLTEKHPLWDVDGLNRQSMQLSKFEGVAAGVVLRHPVFETVSALGLGKVIVTEEEKTKSATGIAFFIKPIGTSPLKMGQDFYKRWLQITEMGFAVWPMAVVADDPASAAQCKTQFDIDPDDKIINVFRIGRVPDGTSVTPARLPDADLILSAKN